MASCGRMLPLIGVAKRYSFTAQQHISKVRGYGPYAGLRHKVEMGEVRSKDSADYVGTLRGARGVRRTIMKYCEYITYGLSK